MRVMRVNKLDIGSAAWLLLPGWQCLVNTFEHSLHQWLFFLSDETKVGISPFLTVVELQ